MSYAERIDGQKIRERSESFRDHFSQASLFWNSQSDAEQEHIVLAFRFELGKVETMHVRERMVDLLTNVDLELATRVAEGIGVPGRAARTAAAMKRLQQGWEKFGVTSVPGKPPQELGRALRGAQHGEHDQGHRQGSEGRRCWSRTASTPSSSRP